MTMEQYVKMPTKSKLEALARSAKLFAKIYMNKFSEDFSVEDIGVLDVMPMYGEDMKHLTGIHVDDATLKIVSRISEQPIKQNGCNLFVNYLGCYWYSFHSELEKKGSKEE